MVFDANLVLVDGRLDWNQTNIGNHGEPTLTSFNAGGFVVIDLLSGATSGYAAGGGESGSLGLAAVFICDEEADNTSADELTLTIEGSDTLAFTAGTIHRLATFDIAAASLGIILGDEVPAIVVRRFTTQWRYIRAHAAVNASADFNTGYVMLSQYPFKTL